MSFRRILRNVAGAALIGLGVIGLFLPFLQGVVMIVGGIALLDFDGKTRFLARARRRLTKWGVPRRWLVPTRAHRARRVARRRERAQSRAALDLPDAVE